MDLHEYATLDATAIAELVRRGEVTPRELAVSAASAFERVNGELNAVIETYPDRIEDLDEGTLGNGPFRGVPFLIKDVGGHEKGRLVEFGSRLCEGMRVQQQTWLFRLLRASGVNVLGRSNAPEFSISGTTENALYGNTSTPWRKGHSSGGSTGGGAAAVASGMVPMAHGSDIGGSIRIPASWCGGVGLKPSRGRISFGPAMDEGGFGMAMNFVQTRSVRDSAAMLDCLCEPQPGDPFIIPRPDRPYADVAREAPPGLRVAWSVKPVMDAPVDPEVAAAVERVAALLADMGHVVVEDQPPFDADAINAKFLDLWFFGFDRRMEGYAAQTGRKVGADTLQPVTLKLYEYAKGVDPHRFMDALAFMNGVRREFGEFFTRHDIWLTPTTAQVSPAHGIYDQGRDDVSVEEFLPLSERPVQFTLPYNVAGTPAISLPLALHSNGLPIGVQLGAGPAAEHLLLQLATRLEEALPWHQRLPPLHVARMG